MPIVKDTMTLEEAVDQRLALWAAEKNIDEIKEEDKKALKRRQEAIVERLMRVWIEERYGVILPDDVPFRVRRMVQGPHWYFNVDIFPNPRRDGRLCMNSRVILLLNSIKFSDIPRTNNRNKLWVGYRDGLQRSFSDFLDAFIWVSTGRSS